jgi:uncharacterized protein (TIGR02246 family)
MMPSPFPGMEPYLENPKIFPDFHDSFLFRPNLCGGCLMSARVCRVIGGVLLATLAAGLVTSWNRAWAQPQSQPAAGQDEARATGNEEREADEASIREQSQEFTRAINRADSKAIAGLCTANCEYYDDNSGEAFRGGAAVEKAFVEFFTQHPKAKAQVDIQAIRFLGRDTALEMGLVQVQLPGPTLPSSSHYRVLHVREDGRWHVAMIEERGADEDKLVDLGWLVGTWLVKSKEGEARLTFAWDEKQPRILCHIARKKGEQFTSSGTQVIDRDPQRGQLRSWNFDTEGGQGQALWSRDGHQWVLDAIGVLPDGTPTSATNILTRLSDDAFTWRSVGRTVAGKPVPDKDEVTATRVKATN